MNRNNIKNLLWVVVLQSGNYILPAATLPILIRYLGPANFGIFNLSQTWSIYFSVIIAYGFDLSATKLVALSNKNRKNLSTIYSKVFFSKIYLCALLFIFFFILVLFNKTMHEHWDIYLTMYIWTLSVVFFQSWLYLGIEKPRNVSIFNFLSRALAFSLVLIFIFKKMSLNFIVIAYVIPQLLVSVLFNFETLKRFNIQIYYVSLIKCFKFLKYCFDLFLSTVAGTITISISIILLGFMATKDEVGYFSVATKFVSLIFGFFLYPFQIVFFPLIIKKIQFSKYEGIQYFKKVLIYSVSLMFFVVILVQIFAPYIIHIFVGHKFDASILPLRIVTVVPLFALADTLFGFLLIAFEKRMVYTFILLIGSFICVLLNLLLIPRYSLIGSSISWLVAELSCFILFISYLFKKKIINAA